ncbi:ABC transporter permease subunit [Streptomyces sp. PLAI1-29]|uniref:ABC transporter permease subunit n=1 Tax=Streptomyces zingiberis TaxID=2053010 RepID=A0ABX1C711_9ACTN|nr:ABC transporter permease subunit [Streptomyces zingiberis]NJQ03682.1 ABC transporter permease subunit [Streptomyces zingiberis]
MDFLVDAWNWLLTPAHWAGAGGAGRRLVEHLRLTGISLALACAVALPLALWLGHRGRGGALAVNLSNAGRAVPTFAVLVLFALTPLGRLGDVPTILALVLFAVPPLLTNAYVGMREADRDAVEAARGMGMSGGQVFLGVELPLAFGLIMTGIRSAAVQIVATATLAALAGGGGLGRIITAGFNTYSTPQVVAGALLVAGLALAVEALLAPVQWLLDPVRRSRGAGRRPGPSAKPAAGTAGGAFGNSGNSGNGSNGSNGISNSPSRISGARGAGETSTTRSELDGDLR